MKLTVLYDPPFWVGVFEREDNGKYSVAREIFGAEPTDPEVWEFVLKRSHTLRFSTPQEEKPEQKKLNPKRLQREVRREMQKVGMVSKAQDALRLEQEKNKKLRKEKSREAKEVEKQMKFEMKQEKKKKKLRGH